MSWLVFSYSLPTQTRSSSRVALWRRLKRLGALAHKSGVYILPDREECLESFQWLSQEVQQARGNATLMRVEKFEGLSDKELIEMFHHLSREGYAPVQASMSRFEKGLGRKGVVAPRQVREKLEKVRNDFAEIFRIDFFHSPYAKQVRHRLSTLGERLAGPKPPVKGLPSLSVADYKQKTWMTRPHPHVDRLGTAWFIRKFVNKHAVIRYSSAPGHDEIPFDIKGAVFGHRGNLCTFETMAAVFHLNNAALEAVAEIIHEIDLRDGRYFRPETEGVARILKGWIEAGFSDQELESHGIALFEGLYAALSRSELKHGK